MTYFDTDVLINAIVRQDERKHTESKELIDSATTEHSIVISTLCVQEALPVLTRLGLGGQQVHGIFDDLMKAHPVDYGTQELRRAVELARHVGFRNINDCIHTAIAETHCTELITYNRLDFGRIQEFARVGVTIL